MAAEKMLSPKDDQNVPEAVKLLKAIVCLATKADKFDKPDERLRLKDLVLYGAICDGMLGVALELASDLSTIVRRALKSAFILFYMYRRHGTALMPAQSYSDYQRIVKELVIVVAKTQLLVKVDGKARNLHPFQLGTDRQETQFCGVRTLTADRNVDAESLPERLSAEMQIREVFEKNPEWDRGSRRLGTETDDKVNVKSVTGCRDVAFVNLRDCYDGGLHDAIAELNEHDDYDVDLNDFVPEEPGANLLKPRGEHVGVTLSSADQRRACARARGTYQ